jgi:DNA-binding transcriptional ArsR family regulator
MHKQEDERALAECATEDHATRPLLRPRVDELAIQTAAGLFRAAGEPARLRLLERLCSGESCVTELAEHLGANVSAVSQQLRLLRAERMVVRRRSGKHVFYALADRHIAELVLGALAHAGEEWRDEETP